MVNCGRLLQLMASAKVSRNKPASIRCQTCVTEPSDDFTLWPTAEAPVSKEQRPAVPAVPCLAPRSTESTGLINGSSTPLHFGVVHPVALVTGTKAFLRFMVGFVWSFTFKNEEKGRTWRLVCFPLFREKGCELAVRLGDTQMNLPVFLLWHGRS